LEGVEFAGVPRTTFNALATYDLTFIPESFATTQLSVNYFYRGSTRGLAVQAFYPTPAFGTVGGRLSFENLLETKFSIAIWASNIGNKHYKLSCIDNLNSIGYAACKWGDPRTFGITGYASF